MNVCVSVHVSVCRLGDASVSGYFLISLDDPLRCAASDGRGIPLSLADDPTHFSLLMKLFRVLSKGYRPYAIFGFIALQCFISLSL